MSYEDQAFQLLSELQLSEYETRAYLSVLEGGVMVARDISDRASIPYAKVYQTLNDLIDKQLITGDEGRPKKFRPRSPEIALKERLDFLEKEWREAHVIRTKQIQSILPELQEIFEDTKVSTEEEQGVWNILGKANIRSRIAKLSKQCMDTILIITGSFERFEDSFFQAIHSNSDCKLVLLSNKVVKHDAINESFVQSSIGPAITIFFDNFAMLNIAEIQKGKYSAGEFTAVLTQISELVGSSKTNYEVLLK